MSDTVSSSVSSSVDDFLEDIDDEAVNDADLDSESNSHQTPVLDSRRRLEARLAERMLARDIQEFDFDL